jgi:hypothetical protein
MCGGLRVQDAYVLQAISHIVLRAKTYIRKSIVINSVAERCRRLIFLQLRGVFPKIVIIKSRVR